ncbi:uncharacterized protein LOC143371164 [Andrena cerasifolii]|uniref:uncharacterized protein LOC143371164 n=1 Tax=Andrena cerasifolii TaxID=2819439 RepID=UPI0040378344
MSLEQLGKFERQNGISVNVYTFGMEKGSTVFPLRLTSRKRDRHVNLLYTPNHEHGDVGHFVLIKDLSRLARMQLSRHREKKFICDRCMHYFGSAEKLEAHSLDCGQMNDCAILLPSEGNNLLKFSNHRMKGRLPFVVYADLECIIEKTEDNHRMGEMDSKLRAYQQHKVHSIAYYMHCSYDTSLSTYRCRRDADYVSWFVNELENFANFAKPILTSNVPMLDLTTEQWTTFRDATHCHICEEPFKAEDVRVRDHCHLSGRFRGPAHSECNLNYKNAFYIPKVFHNLSGYDSHFIIEEIATAFEGSVDVLPITKEKYISFTKNVEDTADSDSRKCIKLRFIDSYKRLEMLEPASSHHGNSRRIFVCHLTRFIKHKDLLKIFGPYGAEHAVLRVQASGNVAFVTFTTPQPAARVASDAITQPITLHKRKLRVMVADAWHGFILPSSSQPSASVPEWDNPFPGHEPVRSALLPVGVIARIAAFLPFADRARMEQVSRTWRDGVHDSFREIPRLALDDWRWPGMQGWR